jgi:hypothetical protein
MAGEPLVRATWVRLFTGALGELTEAEEAQVRERSKAELASLEAASLLAFVPLSLDVALQDHVLAVAGRQGLVSVNRATIQNAMKAPFLGPLVAGTLGVFGATPSGLLHILPRAWTAFTKEAGSFRVESAESGATALHEEVPESLFHSEAYAIGWEGFFEGLCAAVGRKGRVEVERAPPATLRCLVAW